MADKASPENLPVPAETRTSPDTDFWIQEEIYGHRFSQEQEPYMIVLEAISVCASENHGLGSVSRPEGVHENFTYNAPHKSKLRFLLFQERHADNIRMDNSIAPEQKWAVWKKRAGEQYRGTFRSNEIDPFRYLDKRLESDFNKLIQALRILRSLEMDVIHNRRWTSQFLSISGHELVLHDLKLNDNGWSTDRRFFGRGGELVYLMLSRSSDAASTGRAVEKRILAGGGPMGRAASLLTDENDGHSSPRVGYLPLPRHAAYDRLAQDWRSLLEIDGLPSTHLIEPLFRITGLNLVRYFAERNAEVIRTGEPEPLVLDLTGGKNSQIRTVAKNHFERHRHAANEAVRVHVKRRCEDSPAWCEAVADGNTKSAAEILARIFSWKNASNSDAASPQGLQDELVALACKRPKNNIHKYLPMLAKESGLATARAGTGTWFSPTDALLQALVLTNVTTSMELDEFMMKLRDRYGAVIGPAQARDMFSRPPCDARSFEENLLAFENRLTALGLTKRLSDDCAFVQNPYRLENA